MSITEMPPVSTSADDAVATSPMIVSSDAPEYTTLSESDHASKVERRIRLSRLWNLVLYMMTSSMVVGVMYVGVPAYGVFGDDYLWMRYQVRE
jgi:hypothetical protein